MPKKRKTITMPKRHKTKSTASSSSSPSSVAASSSKRLKGTENLRNEEAQENVEVADGLNESSDSEDESQTRFLEEPLPPEDARRRWPKRYLGKVNSLFFFPWHLKFLIIIIFFFRIRLVNGEYSTKINDRLQY